MIALLPVLLTMGTPQTTPEIRAPLPYVVPARMKDRAETLPPEDIRVEGWLGQRLHVNEANRLLVVDTVPLLEGFKHKPGTHPWIGEHVGKWMHAATLAWAYTGDRKLRTKLDAVAAELIATQEPDGYLGTYVPEKRFGLFDGADWDVWSHKYNLIGLLTYYQFTGNQPALGACRKMGDLLIHTFGPGKKSILSAGTHMGMAATSVLEPMVLLYRNTGDSRYLEFARYIVKSWDEPGGPGIIHALLTEKQVNKTANAKAYEMLSNLVGLCELARVTGDSHYLEPALNAWSDIAAKRLYITGSASQGEMFSDDYVLPNKPEANVAETCVTTTWIQLNLQLLRLTGEAKYGNELEKTIYNHLAAAQNPRGADWCYFTPLEGKKSYDKDITCCHSSGPRGMALAPLTAYLKRTEDGRDAVMVSTFETGWAALDLGGQRVKIEQHSKFPSEGLSELIVRTSRPARFSILVRVPTWASPIALSVNGEAAQQQAQDDWAIIPARQWSEGDRVSVRFAMSPRLVTGDHGNKGMTAMEWGPFVMAYDSVFNSFVPFADAGSTGGTYKVWLPTLGR